MLPCISIERQSAFWYSTRKILDPELKLLMSASAGGALDRYSPILLMQPALCLPPFNLIYNIEFSNLWKFGMVIILHQGRTGSALVTCWWKRGTQVLLFLRLIAWQYFAKCIVPLMWPCNVPQIQLHLSKCCSVWLSSCCLWSSRQCKDGGCGTFLLYMYLMLNGDGQVVH